jgi:hypothetical protein
MDEHLYLKWTPHSRIVFKPYIIFFASNLTAFNLETKMLQRMMMERYIFYVLGKENINSVSRIKENIGFQLK